MSDYLIKINNLGKKYTISHKSEEGYLTIRDIVSDKLRSFFSESDFQKETAGSGKHSLSDNKECFWALRGVEFEVKRGEVIGIIGRNGAGKSTLLKILSRITEPTEGEVRITGRVASLLEVGTGFHPELTGRENIFLNGAVLGMKRHEIKRKFDEIVEFAGVTKFLDTPVKRYSSGMYVRLAFAVAAHLEPEILIVDEVLAVGDSQFQKKCLLKMNDVASKEGRTVLFVSHNLQAIENLCSRAMVLQAGEKAFDGEVNAAIASYYKSLQNNLNVDLKARKDRQGNGKVQFTSMTIYNRDGLETNAIGMGESFRIDLTTQGKTNNAIIGIHFGNMFRSHLIRGYSYEQVSQTIYLNEEAHISCEFIDFPMIQGIYDIHIWIGTFPTSECFDHVERAGSLEIIGKDFFGTGKPLDPHGGLAFCKTAWKLNDCLLI